MSEADNESQTSKRKPVRKTTRKRQAAVSTETIEGQRLPAVKIRGLKPPPKPIKSEKVLNWLKMPLCMKIESKIVSMLLLHLDLFIKGYPSPLIDRLKLEYEICTAFAHEFRLDVVNSMSFSFVSRLSDLCQSISPTTNRSQRIDERVVSLLRQHISARDPIGTSMCQFTTRVTCTNCDTDSTDDSSGHFLAIPHDMTYFKLGRATIRWREECPDCRTMSLLKKITLRAIPQFLVLHCPSGVRYQGARFDEVLSGAHGRLMLAAVVECGPGPASVGLPQRRSTRQQHAALAVVTRPASIPTWCAHLRQKGTFAFLH